MAAEDEDEFQLAIQHRPQTLDTYMAPAGIKTLARGVIDNKRNTAGVLITGPTGTGKTTLAKIIAYGINGLPYGTSTTDIYELNAGADGGVDKARELQHYYNRVPQAKKNVIIIDEIQKMTKAAMSVILKPLEEPRKNRLFILCTNEPEALLQTVRDRCLRIDLDRPDEKELAAYLAVILKKEKALQDEKPKQLKKLLKAVVESAGGIPRAALGVLENAITARGDYDNLKDLIKSPVLKTPTLELDQASIKIIIGLCKMHQLAQKKDTTASDMQKLMGAVVGASTDLDSYAVINRLTVYGEAITRELLTGDNIPQAWPLKKAAQVVGLKFHLPPLLAMIPKLVLLKERAGGFQVNAALLLLSFVVECGMEFSGTQDT